MLAGLGTGWYASHDDVVDVTVRVVRRHQARPSPELDDRYRSYLDLADRIGGLVN